jgi:hypothetical protein
MRYLTVGYYTTVLSALLSLLLLAVARARGVAALIIGVKYVE